MAGPELVLALDGSERQASGYPGTTGYRSPASGAAAGAAGGGVPSFKFTQ
jgi:hypothetical protein